MVADQKEKTLEQKQNIYLSVTKKEWKTIWIRN